MDDTASASDLRRVDRTLRESVRHARAEFDSGLASVRADLGAFAGTWESAQDVHDALADEHESLAHEVTGVARALRLLGEKVEWLIATALSTHPSREWQLEDEDGSLVELSAAAERGERFKRHLLGSHARQGLWTDSDNHRLWSEKLAARYATAVALSKAVAAIPAGAPTPAPVATEFRAARDELTALEREGPALAELERTARRKLAADESARRDHGDVIAAGERAGRELHERVHAAVAAAVDEHALFPPWFRDSLGLIPASGAADAWLALATEIVAYRVTYGVTSRRSPLGEPSESDDTSRRGTWHARLVASLENLD
jgi:hypothetical protein